MGYKVKRIMIGDKQVRPVIPPFTPGANTVAYYKFDGNLSDSSGNGRNMSLSAGSFTYHTLTGGAKYVQTAPSAYTSLMTGFPRSSSGGTISFWMSFYNPTRGNGASSGYVGASIFELRYGSSGNLIRPVISWQNPNAYTLDQGFQLLALSSSHQYVPSVNESRHLYTMVCNSGSLKTYIDGQLWDTYSIGQYSSWYFIFNTNNGSTSDKAKYSSTDKVSELIFENKAWTVTEISNYYNASKSYYGL